MKNIKILSSAGILIAIVLFLAVNILSHIIFKSARIDLTDNDLYTLSQGTKNIIRNFDEPITLRFFFSEKLATGIPQLSNYAKRVRELLEEYANESNDKVRLIVIDPEAFTDDEDLAVEFGLQGVPIDAAGSIAYFGLAGTNSVDDNEVIPFFQMEKEASLEYDLTKLVYKLGNPKKPVVGLLSVLPIQGDGGASPFMPGPANKEWTIINQLRLLFDIRTLSTDVVKIPSEVDILMLVHPKALSDKTLFAIDQFVLGGGHALIFVDSHAESDQTPPDPQNPMAAALAPKNSDLKKLFNQWGIELVPGMLAGDIDAAARVNISTGLRPQTVDYVLWLQLNENNISKDDFVTSDLKQINLATSGYFKKLDGRKTQITPLMQTGKNAMSIPEASIKFRPDPGALIDNYKSGNKKLTLAARISGPVDTAFPNGPPDAEVFDGPVLKESQASINIIVVADTDMLEDKFWVTVQNFFGQQIAVPRANNGAFVANALENLGGSNDLITLRSRGDFSRPFEKVKEIQREAEKRFRSQEKLLVAKLKDTEQKIQELQRQKGAGQALIVSPEQKQAIEKFQSEKRKTRKELRNVQHELRRDIETLGTRLKIINIGLIPLLIIIFAIALGIYRHKQLSRLTQ